MGNNVTLVQGKNHHRMPSSLIPSDHICSISGWTYTVKCRHLVYGTSRHLLYGTSNMQLAKEQGRKKPNGITIWKATLLSVCAD